MRTGLIVSIVLLAAALLGGAAAEQTMYGLSRRYESAAEELTALALAGDWDRAEQTASAYLGAWENTVHWLQMLINHEDADDVTLALIRYLAGTRARDAGLCLTAGAELREHAVHLFHRDALSLGNVL